MPPPRGITAARPPFLPLRLDASARLGGVLGRLGGVWGASWGVLGRQKTISKTKLMLRAKMSGPQSSPKLRTAPYSSAEIIFGCQNATKTAPRRVRNGSCFASYFQCTFSSILARFSLPTWLPKTTKIEEKSVQRCLPKLTSFWDRFLIDF